MFYTAMMSVSQHMSMDINLHFGTVSKIYTRLIMGCLKHTPKLRLVKLFLHKIETENMNWIYNHLLIWINVISANIFFKELDFINNDRGQTVLFEIDD